MAMSVLSVASEEKGRHSEDGRVLTAKFEAAPAYSQSLK